MKLTKCENKHFYDSDKYDICPHCEKEMGAVKAAAAVPKMDKPGASTGASPKAKEVDTLSPHTGSIWTQGEDKKTASFMDEFAAHGKNLAPEPTVVPMSPMFCGSCGAELRINAPFCGVCGFKAKQSETQVSPSEQPQPTHTDFGAVQKLFDDESSLVTNYHHEKPDEPDALKGERTTAPLFDAANVTNKVDATPSNSTSTMPKPTAQSLKSQVNAVAAHGSTEDVKTVAFYDFADTEPVVGWLVCVKGEYLGQSFNLKAGQNFIGRALNMDVPLAKDTSVSRNKHAIITYDPQNRVFFIQPGESNGLTYLNNNLLLAHQPINAYEKIKVGNSELIFVPCCGEQFAWEDYIQ